MNKIKVSLIICIVFFPICISCSDIIEPDISYEVVVLLAPTDSLITRNTIQTFWWEDITGSLWYELQVVSPNFSNISSLKLDTILEKNNFQFSLQPGVYHWRVKALNGSSSTGYSENTLVIIDSQ